MMRFLLVLSCALVSLLAAIFSLVRAAENPVSREDRDAYRIELPVEVRSNTRVAQFLKFFTQQAKVGFRDALARSGRYLPAMTQIFREQGLPKELLHLCMIESEFIPQAYSSDHNSGLWQFTRTTALHYGLKINPWLDERRDPIKSTRAAAAYLRDLHAQFKEWLLVVAAFNAGESSVRAALNRLGKQTLPLLKTPFLKPNTEDFVAKFVATTIISRKPVHYGFQEIAYHDELEFEEVLIQEPLELSQIAQLAETDVDTLRQLNPALLQDMTPPQHEPFALRLPSGKAELLVRAHGLLFATPPNTFPDPQSRGGRHALASGTALRHERGAADTNQRP
jgi:membrane-bound lytic murein transglycosylase D